MAKTQEKTHQSFPKTTHSFLGCFGFSEKVVHTKSFETTKTPGHRRKRNCLFSWIRLQHKKHPATTNKTVSFDAGPIPEKFKSQLKPNKSKPPVVSKLEDPTANQGPTLVPDTPPATSDLLPPNENPDEAKNEPPQTIILENHKRSDTSKANTCQIEVPRRLRNNSLGTFTGPSSPTVERKSTRASTIRPSQSLPTLNPNREIAVMGSATESHTKSNHQFERVNDELSNKIDPIVGMSIILVTLLILLLWGRLCAILCTSAWLYFTHRARYEANKIAEISSNSNNTNLDSELKKKKVVFEGFLERNRTSAVGILDSR